jgi:hypothetical protein
VKIRGGNDKSGDTHGRTCVAAKALAIRYCLCATRHPRPQAGLHKYKGCGVRNLGGDANAVRDRGAPNQPYDTLLGAIPDFINDLPGPASSTEGLRGLSHTPCVLVADTTS